MKQRAIKYRAWDKKRKRIYKVIYLNSETLNGDGNITWATVEGFDIIEQKSFHMQIQPNDCILMQSTGFTLACGNQTVEIFEGDILKSFHFRESATKVHYLYHRVVWSQEYGCWATISMGHDDESLKTSGNQQLTFYLRGATEVSITGNIYETKKPGSQQVSNIEAIRPVT